MIGTAAGRADAQVREDETKRDGTGFPVCSSAFTDCWPQRTRPYSDEGMVHCATDGSQGSVVCQSDRRTVGAGEGLARYQL